MSRRHVIRGAIGLGILLYAGAIVWFTLRYFHSTSSPSSPQKIAAVAHQARKAKSKHAPAKDPLVTVAKSSEQDDALVQWLQGWSGHPTGTKASPEQLQQLKAILEQTPLYSPALFDIAHGFHASYTDPAASLMFYQAAAAHAHEELAENATSPAEVSKILDGMMRNRADFEHVLWPMIQGIHDPAALDTLYSIYSDFMHYLPARDKKLAKIAESERIQIAQCCFLKGQPDEALSVFKESDPDLVQWIKDWKAGPGQKQQDANPNQLHRLQDILSRTALESPALFDLADAFHSGFAAAPLASEAVYAAAAQRAHHELSQDKDSKSEVANILHAMARNHEDFKHVLWPLINDHRDPQAIATLYTLYSDFLHYAPSDDKKIASVAQSERIGFSECLYLKGKYDQALSLIEQCDKEKLSRERRASLEWIWSMVLYDTHHYSEALPHLRAVAQVDGSDQSLEAGTKPPSSTDETDLKQKYAMALLVASLAETENMTGANAVFDEWIQRYHPTVEQAQSVEKIILLHTPSDSR